MYLHQLLPTLCVVTSFMIAIHPLPIYTDNYIWIISNETEFWAVDPGYEWPVIHYMTNTQKRLKGILVTHKHWDHISGIEPLKQYVSQSLGETLPVYGPAHWAASQVTHTVDEGDSIEAMGARIQVFNLTGHTKEHIGFYLPQCHALFSGDTLFSAGCGRVFDGTTNDLCKSIRKINALPEQTAIYATHEYTENNLRFANAVEPNNRDIHTYQVHCQKLRSDGRPTLPTHLNQERKINPYLRVREPTVVAAATQWAGQSLTSDNEVFATLRAWKNTFKG